MSFREKSAWAMGVVMLVTGLIYLRMVLFIPADAPAIAQIGPLVPYVVAVIVASICVQAALAVLSPGEAQQPADERERVAIHRAGSWSGRVLAFAVLAGAINYLVHGNGNWLFLWVMGGLIVAQIAEYAFQIWLFRKGA